ncbi:MAG TPA: recombinase XerD [Desulfotomaculum sp.]|nr:recombinase XerD [Desulfotomaculum sp.]
MGKKGSIYYQLSGSLKSQQAFGQSKHQIKHKAIEAARAAGLSGSDVWDAMNKAIFDAGIFSYETYKNYHKVAREFSDYCKRNGVTGNLEKARELVPEYLKQGIRNKSVWSVKLDRAGLRKAFKDHDIAREVEIPKRKKENITRSRRAPLTVINEKNKNVIEFTKATGLRRRELATVRAKDIYTFENKLFVHVSHGKGGKERDVPVLSGHQDQVLKIVQNHESNDRIFKDLPTTGLHFYRREYAQERYRELGREKDHEREIIREISHDLGHARIDVVTTYYL